MSVLSGATIAVLAAGLLAMTGRADAQEPTREELNHDFIFDLAGISKKDIYDRTEKWIINNLRSPRAVIQSEDPDVGLIVANGTTTMTAEGDSMQVSLSFRLSVDVREGKERARFLYLEISRRPGAGWEQIPAEGIWHRGAQKKLVQIARILNEYVKMKGEP